MKIIDVAAPPRVVELVTPARTPTPRYLNYLEEISAAVRVLSAASQNWEEITLTGACSPLITHAEIQKYQTPDGRVFINGTLRYSHNVTTDPSVNLSGVKFIGRLQVASHLDVAGLTSRPAIIQAGSKVTVTVTTPISESLITFNNIEIK